MLSNLPPLFSRSEATIDGGHGEMVGPTGSHQSEVARQWSCVSNHWTGKWTGTVKWTMDGIFHFSVLIPGSAV